MLGVKYSLSESSSESQLSNTYSYVTGEYNYCYPEDTKVDDVLNVNLDKSVADLE